MEKHDLLPESLELCVCVLLLTVLDSVFYLKHQELCHFHQELLQYYLHYMSYKIWHIS